MYTPLTIQQYQAAQKAGFSPTQIIANEKIRQQKENTPPPTPPKEGFFKSLVKDPIKTLIVKPGTRIAQAAVGGVKSLQMGSQTGKQEQNTAQIHSLLDQINQATDPNIKAQLTTQAKQLVSQNIPNAQAQQNTQQTLAKLSENQNLKTSFGNYNIEAQKSGTAGVAQIAGDAAKAASYLYTPGGAEAAIGKKTIGQAIIQGGKTGAIAGGLYGAGNAAQQEKPTVGGIAKGGAIGGGIGGVTGGIIGGATQFVANKIPNLLKTSAEKNYADVLKPTTKANKAITNKIAPGLNDRGVVVLTRQGLEDKATQNIQNIGSQIEEKWAALPKETQVNTSPALEAIQNLKDSFTITNNQGQKVVVNPTGYAHAQQLEQTIMDMGGDISAESMRKAKQILDSSIYSPTQGVLKVQTATESSLANAQKTAADSMRGILNDATPDIAKLNSEFNFWSKVKTVISATNQRMTGQAMPIGEKIADTAAVATGLAKGGLKKAGIYGATTDLLIKAVRSAAWKTVSAQTKNSLANALAKGANEEASNILTKIVTASAVKQKTTK